MNPENIQIVLVNTSHPGNIGACARAMKTMGLNQLTLVSPKHFPHHEAEAMSSWAEDVLQNAKVVATLKEAIKDSQFIIGTSARLRSLSIKTQDPRSLAPKILEVATTSKVSIIFGRESSGLTNEEMDLCHQLMHIPSDEEYGSLNVAQAVQVVCYELRITSITPVSIEDEIEELATFEETEGFFTHLETTLWDIKFIRPHNPKEVLRKLRRLFSRTYIKKEEVNILRGILKAIKDNTSREQKQCEKF